MTSDPTAELQRCVEEAIHRHATDIFLVPGEPVAYRIGGKIERTDADPLTSADVARIATAVVGDEAASRLGAEMGYAHGRVRLSDAACATVTVARSAGELTVVARPVRTFVFDVHQLRVPATIVQAVESASGLVIVTGPPGSGKTTTAYALLEHLNATREIHIVTVGYLLEYILEPKRALVQQRQVGVDVPDMLSGMQSALMQDPDVLFVGEIRSLEDFQACLGAAELNHLVITQLHQPTPEAALQRVIDLQSEETRPTFRALLARMLRGVLAQRLLPRADGKGLVAAYGAMIPDERTRHAIATGEPLPVPPDPLPVGCQSLRDDIMRLSDEGAVPVEAAQEAIEALK